MEWLERTDDDEHARRSLAHKVELAGVLLMVGGVITCVVLVHRVEAVAWLILGVLAAANVLLYGLPFAHGSRRERASEELMHDRSIDSGRR